MAYSYPSQYEDKNKLLYFMGPFWSALHVDAVVHSYIFGRGQMELQMVNDFTELVNCAGRQTMPLYHTVHVQPYKLLESDKEIQDDNSVAWPAPDKLVDAIITEKIQDAAVCLLNHIDFRVEDGLVIFREDPFLNTTVEQEEILLGGEVIDIQVTLWLNEARFDQSIPEEQFGYAIGLKLPTSQNYKDLINAFLDAVVSGTAKEQIERAISLLVGIPLILSDDETVELLYETLEATAEHVPGGIVQEAAQAVGKEYVIELDV